MNEERKVHVKKWNKVYFRDQEFWFRYTIDEYGWSTYYHVDVAVKKRFLGVPYLRKLVKKANLVIDKEHKGNVKWALFRVVELKTHLLEAAEANKRNEGIVFSLDCSPDFEATL